MTLQTSADRQTFNGSGGTGPFTFNFRFFQNSDIMVIRVTGGVATSMVETIDYTLTGAGSYSGGSITLVNALQSGETMTVARIMDIIQPTSIRNQSAYFPSLHEDTFDRLTMLIQQVNDVAQSVRLTVAPTAAGAVPVIEADASLSDVTIDINGLSFVIVSKKDATANKVIISDSSGKTVEGLTQYRDGLQGMNETVFLVLMGTDWKVI